MAGLSADDNRADGRGKVNWGDPTAVVNTRWQMKYVGGDRAAGHGVTRNPFAWPEGNTPEEAQRLRQVLARDKQARAAGDPWSQFKLQGKQHGMAWEPEAVSGSLMGADQEFVDTYGGDGSVFEGDRIRGDFAQADPDGGEQANRVISGKGGLV